MNSRQHRSAKLASVLALCLFVGRGLAQAPGGELIRQQDLFTSQNVLSPNEVDDWPLQARAGETVIVAVNSSAFDPAVEIVGPNGATVAQNDDVRQGQQDSLLLQRLANAGAYKVRVKASRPPAAGRYSILVRRFVAGSARLGARAAGTLGKSLARWHAFEVAAGQAFVVTGRSAAFEPTVEVYAPNGEALGTVGAAEGQKGVARGTVRALQGGTHYARVAASGSARASDSYSFTAALARVFALRPGTEQPTGLEAGGVDLWSFEARPGDLLRLQAKAPSPMSLQIISATPPGRAEAEEAEEAVGGEPPRFVVLSAGPKPGGEVFVLFNAAGPYQVEVSQPLGLGAAYSLAATPALKVGAGGEASGALALGGSDYWAIEGRPGRIVRFEGASDQFDAALTLYSPRGEAVASNDDGAGAQGAGTQGAGASRDALLTALLLEEGRYLLRLHAFGDGGAGSYRLRRAADPVRPIPAGGAASGSVGEGGSEIWSFAARAGQTVILSGRSDEFDLKVSLFAPDGTEVASDEDGGEGTDSLLSARLPIDGAYTVWVAAQSGGGKYSLQKVEAK